jgi:hypothetical protein
LNIYLGQIYGWVKKGEIKNYLEGGYPEGKGILVDPNEVKIALLSSKRKGPRGPSKRKELDGGAVRRSRKGSNGEATPEPISRRLPTGAIVSYSKGQGGGELIPKPPKFNVGQVIGSTGKLTFLDDGNHRRHYTGVLINNIVFTTERLGTMMARGIARIEHPVPLLGMILLAFVTEGRLELAQSLEDWMTNEGLDVMVPELLDVSDEPEGPEEEAKSDPDND